MPGTRRVLVTRAAEAMPERGSRNFRRRRVRSWPCSVHGALEALAAFEALVDRLGDALEPDLREQASRAMLRRGIALFRQRRMDDAIAAYESLIDRFKDATDPRLQVQVGRAMLCRRFRTLSGWGRGQVRRSGIGWLPQIALRSGSHELGI